MFPGGGQLIPFKTKRGQLNTISANGRFNICRINTAPKEPRPSKAATYQFRALEGADHLVRNPGSLPESQQPGYQANNPWASPAVNLVVASLHNAGPLHPLSLDQIQSLTFLYLSPLVSPNSASSPSTLDWKKSEGI